MKKSNLLNFRATAREKRTKKQRGKVIAFPERTVKTAHIGELLFAYKGKLYHVRNLPVEKLTALRRFADSLNAESSAS